MGKRSVRKNMLWAAVGSAALVTLLALPISHDFRAAIAAEPTAAFATSTGERIADADAEPQNWLTTGRNYSETRFSPLSAINSSNAASLGLLWSQDLDTARTQESTPLAVDGVLYTTSAWSKIQAFDAVSGKLLWQFDPKVPGAHAVKACCDVVNRGAAYWNGKVYIGTIDGRLIAVDAKSGQPVWSTRTTDIAKDYTITGAPRIVKGQVIIGNGGSEYGVRGYVSAYNAETGKLTWRFYTVPGKPGVKDGAASDAILAKLAGKTWSGNWWNDLGGGGGGTAWDSMAYDPELDLLYIGVGNASFWSKKLRSPGEGDNLFVSSILALRPETGEYVWHFQTTPGDEWDYTATQHMILTDLTIDGKVRKVLMQAPKNGFFYVLDRANGKLISAKPYVPVDWATSLDPITGRPNVNPEARYDLTGRPWKAKPSGMGGHNWQPMAYNAKTGLVYIPVQEFSAANSTDPHFKRNPVGNNTGMDYMTNLKLNEQIAKEYPPKGYLLAWDPVKQKEAWRLPQPTLWNGGVLATAGNILVQGNGSGRLNLINASTGKILWSFDAQTGIVAAPITYAVNGTQYISVVVGAPKASFFDGPGNGKQGVKGGENAVIPSPPKGRVLTFALGAASTLPKPEALEAYIPVAPKQIAGKATILEGERLYNRSCFFCHGLKAEQRTGIYPDLRHSAAIADKNSFKSVVWDGVLEANGMVSFRKNYTLKQVEALRAFLINQARREQNLPD